MSRQRTLCLACGKPRSKHHGDYARCYTMADISHGKPLTYWHDEARNSAPMLTERAVVLAVDPVSEANGFSVHPVSPDNATSCVPGEPAT